jgi:DNA repair protein RecO
VATLLKGALRPKSPFLGEYELFGTSELLYYPRRTATLHVGKECALLVPRETFRRDWRAMMTASCLTALFYRSTPEEAHDPGLFSLLEELLDQAAACGGQASFLFWAELRFCDYHGNRPHLDCCTMCGTEQAFKFSASSGGMVCARCAGRHQLPAVDCPPDISALLRRFQQAAEPAIALKTRLSVQQKIRLNELLGHFLAGQFGLPTETGRAWIA